MRQRLQILWLRIDRGLCYRPIELGHSAIQRMGMKMAQPDIAHCGYMVGPQPMRPFIVCQRLFRPGIVAADIAEVEDGIEMIGVELKNTLETLTRRVMLLQGPVGSAKIEDGRDVRLVPFHQISKIACRLLRHTCLQTGFTKLLEGGEIIWSAFQYRPELCCSFVKVASLKLKIGKVVTRRVQSGVKADRFTEVAFRKGEVPCRGKGRTG